MQDGGQRQLTPNLNWLSQDSLGLGLLNVEERIEEVPRALEDAWQTWEVKCQRGYHGT